MLFAKEKRKDFDVIQVFPRGLPCPQIVVHDCRMKVPSPSLAHGIITVSKMRVIHLWLKLCRECHSLSYSSLILLQPQPNLKDMYLNSYSFPFDGVFSGEDDTNTVYRGSTGPLVDWLFKDVRDKIPQLGPLYQAKTATVFMFGQTGL